MTAALRLAASSMSFKPFAISNAVLMVPRPAKTSPTIRNLYQLKVRSVPLASRVVEVMPLYWLCCRHNNSIFVVIEPANSLIHARLRASLDGLDQGEFH